MTSQCSCGGQRTQAGGVYVCEHCDTAGPAPHSAPKCKPCARLIVVRDDAQMPETD